MLQVKSVFCKYPSSLAEKTRLLDKNWTLRVNHKCAGVDTTSARLNIFSVRAFLNVPRRRWLHFLKVLKVLRSVADPGSKKRSKTVFFKKPPKNLVT